LLCLQNNNAMSQCNMLSQHYRLLDQVTLGHCSMLCCRACCNLALLALLLLVPEKLRHPMVHFCSSLLHITSGLLLCGLLVAPHHVTRNKSNDTDTDTDTDSQVTAISNNDSLVAPLCFLCLLLCVLLAAPRRLLVPLLSLGVPANTKTVGNKGLWYVTTAMTCFSTAGAASQPWRPCKHGKQTQKSKPVTYRWL
jgi:hypothetical protein